MPNGLYNWTFRDITKFLNENGFSLLHVKSSHYYYGKQDGMMRIVQVPFHGAKAIKPRTLQGIMHQSGIPRARWMGK